MLTGTVWADTVWLDVWNPVWAARGSATPDPATAVLFSMASEQYSFNMQPEQYTFSISAEPYLFQVDND